MELARSCSLLPGLAYGIALATLILATTDCASRESVATSQQAQYEAQRKRMVDLIASRGVRDSTTLRAMRGVRRHEFVPGELESSAYGDHPLPIGFGQTISQPYIVAYMTEVLRPRPGMKVLEVGTGSGYQAAVLAEAGCDVYTIEISKELASSARERLARLGYGRVRTRHGDGYKGWAEVAPFDAIIVTAAADRVPPPLLEQLKPGGRMVIPEGDSDEVQRLTLIEKDAKGKVSLTELLPVRFVPLLRE
jgi:protein-L-isoaspartate(D-aspartate) O-methyltransferase